MEKRSNSVWCYIAEMIASLVTVVFLLLNCSGDYNRIVAVLLLFLNGFALIKVRNNWLLFIIFSIITYSNYSICIVNHLSNSFDLYFARYASSSVGITGLNILLAFSLLLLLIAPWTQKTMRKKLSLMENNRRNPIIVYGISVVLVLIWVFGFHRPEMLGERGSPTALYEYSIVFFIVSFYYSGKERLLIGINLVLAFAFALQNFLYGGRITGLQIVIVVAICLLIDRFTIKRVIPIGSLFFIVLSGIGQVRADILYQGLNIRATLNSIFSNYFALDTAYSSYYTSMTFLDELNRTALGQRLYLFMRWMLSMLIGGKAVPDSNLADYTRQFYLHYSGGVLPYFAWFYLGTVGIILLSFYLRFLFRLITRTNAETRGLVRCISAYVCASTFRWYLYSPSQLFRGVILLCFVYGSAFVLDGLLSGEKAAMAWNTNRR